MRAKLPQSHTDNIIAERLSWLPWLLLLGLNGLRSWRSRQQDTSQHPVTAPRGARRAHIASLAGAAVLIAPLVPAGVLDRRWLPGRQFRAPVGLLLEVLGLGLVFWARAILGQYWTTRIAPASTQPLIQNGPYGVVRHPLYVGILAGAGGTVLVAGQVRGILGLGLLAAAYRRKIADEETALREHFGDAYTAYAAITPAYLPRLRSRRTP